MGKLFPRDDYEYVALVHLGRFYPIAVKYQDWTNQNSEPRQE